MLPQTQSPIHESSPFNESRKLVRCEVAGDDGENRVWFVEIDAFTLWEHLMTHGHGLRVGHTDICLWVHEDEYRRNARMFDRTGAVETVDRIIVDLFDGEYGSTQAITRYASAIDTEKVLGVLRSQIPAARRESAGCQIAVIHGRVVNQGPPRTGRHLTGIGG